MNSYGVQGPRIWVHAVVIYDLSMDPALFRPLTKIVKRHTYPAQENGKK